MLKVVKIKFKALLLSIVVFALLMNVAYAAGSKLVISNVDVKVGGKTLRGLHNGDSISEEARPDKPVEFRVEVRNNFTSRDDVRIQDITVRTTIERIDDGNDLKQESERFDLRADTESKNIFLFNIPLEVLEDTYTVIIEAEGQDENRTFESAEMRLKLEVVKENHDLRIIKKTLIPTDASCNRKNIQLSTTILNVGNNDEDSASIKISNPDLGIDINDQFGGLKARPNEPESRFSKTYPFKISDSVEAGSYPISIKVIYDNDRKVTQETATLNVKDCTTKQVTTTSTSKGTTGGPVTVTIGSSATPSTKPEIPPGTTVTQESLLQNNIFVIGVIIGEVFAVIVGIVLVASLLRRKG